MAVSAHITPHGYEMNSTLSPFTNERVVIYATEVPGCQARDILDVKTEFVINNHPFMRPAFVASQIRFTDSSADCSNIGSVIAEANGRDVTAVDPYALFTKHGTYIVTDNDVLNARCWVVVSAWCSSEAATTWDYLDIVPGYGRLYVLRFSIG